MYSMLNYSQNNYIYIYIYIYNKSENDSCTYYRRIFTTFVFTNTFVRYVPIHLLVDSIL